MKSQTTSDADRFLWLMHQVQYARVETDHPEGAWRSLRIRIKPGVVQDAEGIQALRDMIDALREAV